MVIHAPSVFNSIFTQNVICSECSHLIQDIVICSSCRHTVPRLLGFSRPHALEFGHKLNSNTLTPADKDGLREDLIQAKALARAYLALLMCTQNNYCILYEAIPIIERAIDGAGIQRLPPEILSLIFSFVVTEPSQVYGPEYSRYNARGHDVLHNLDISHVCSLWRRVALATPALWSKIHIYKPSYVQPMKDMDHNRVARSSLLSLLLTRSKATTLTVDFSIQNPTGPSITPEALGLARILNSHVQRIENLSIGYPALTLLPGLKKGAQALKSLRFVWDGGEAHSASSFSLIDFTGTPRLSHLECTVPRTPTALPTLAVTNLTLSTVWFDNLSFWENFPQLRMLRVATISYPNQEAMAMVHLPTLVVLSVEMEDLAYADDSRVLLDWYDVPSVENVTICCTAQGHLKPGTVLSVLEDPDVEAAVPFDPQGLVDFCRRSHRCRKLVLADIVVGPQSLRTALELLSELEELSIRKVCYLRNDEENHYLLPIEERLKSLLGASFFTSLTNNLLPRLQSLVIETPVSAIPSSTVMDFLSYRFHSSSSMKKMKLIFQHLSLPTKLRAGIQVFAESLSSDTHLEVEHQVTVSFGKRTSVPFPFVVEPKKKVARVVKR
ncbi:hypothetical protein DL96DRAFT_1619989 [Flagelloscypha sp. PMI_526]|nr:hypothetical protein DL96DRAFT_1619989 [Flagelloscypha sp. PMI_526]